MVSRLAELFPDKRLNPEKFGSKLHHLHSHTTVCCDLCTLMSTHAYASSEIEDTPSLIVHQAHEYLNIVNIITKSAVLPTRALIDTGALHGSYAATGIRDLFRREEGRVNISSQLVCSPINDSCTLITDNVIADVLIFSIDKKIKFKCQIKFKVLPILDNKPYNLIIGRPDIVRHNLLDKFASQWHSETNIVTEGEAEKSHGHVTAHSETNPHHVAVLSDTMPSGDMSQHEGVHTLPSLGAHQYDEDEEVIPHEHWDDAWQKNDSDVANDMLDAIMNNVQSNNTEFKIRTRRVLERCEEVFDSHVLYQANLHS